MRVNEQEKKIIMLFFCFLLPNAGVFDRINYKT